MPLTPQRLSVPMVGGQRPDAAAQILPPDGSALVELVNLRHHVSGELRVRDCPVPSGLTSTDTAYIGAGLIGERLVTIGESAISTDGVTLGQSRDLTLERLRDVDTASYSSFLDSDLATDGTSQLCLVTSGTAGARWYDMDFDGFPLQEGIVPTALREPHIVFYSGYWLLFACDSGNNLVYFSRALGASTWTAGGTLVAASVERLDAVMDPLTAGRGWIAWTKASGWNCGTFTVSSGVVTLVTSAAGSATAATHHRVKISVSTINGGSQRDCCVAVVKTAGGPVYQTDVVAFRYNVGVVFASSVVTLTGNSATTTGARAGLAICWREPTQTWAVWAPGNSTSPTGAYAWSSLVYSWSSLAVGATTVTPCVAPTGPVIPHSDGCLFLCEVGGTGQLDSSLVWYDLRTGVTQPFPVATAAVGETLAQSTADGTRRLGGRAVGGAFGAWYYVAPRVNSGAGELVSMVCRALHHADTESGATVLVGNQLAVSGGVPVLVGPSGVTLAAPERGPYVILAAVAGGGTLAAGTYSIALQFERRAPDGTESPSFVAFSTVTVAINQQITLTVAPLFDSGPVRLRVYVSASGGPYYEMWPTTYQTGIGSADIVLPAITAAPTSGPILEHGYPGGPVSPEPVRSSRVVAAWGGRLWLAGVEGDPYTVWPSTPPLAGHAPIFSSQLRVPVPAEAGRVTGLLSLDDRLLVLCELGAWYLSGDGVDAQLQGAWSGPYRIPGVGGCLVGRSAVSHESGAYWWSSRGIERLSRGGEAQLQAPAYKVGVNSSAVWCVRAAADRQNDLIRFAIATSAPGSTNRHQPLWELVLDTVRGAWVTYEYPYPAIPSDRPFSCPAFVLSSAEGDTYALIIGENPYAIYPDGYANAGTGNPSIAARIKLPVSFDSVSGFQRLWRWGIEFGKVNASVTLKASRVSAANPSTDSPLEQSTAFSLSGTSSLTDVWVSQHVAKQEAIRHLLTVEIEQNQDSSGPVELTTIRGILLEYGLEPGTGRRSR